MKAHMKSRLSIMLFASIWLMVGCANNPYKNFYNQHQVRADYRTNPEYQLGSGEPTIIRTRNQSPTEENLKLMEDGYAQIGYSSFIGDLQGERGAVEQAKNLNASLVLIMIPKNDGELPTSQYSGGIRVEQAASYWVKTKPNPERFGIHLKPLSDGVANMLGSNKAIQVQAVIRNSPAFFSDLMRDDVIISMDGESVYDQNSFANAIKNKKGKKIEIVIYRNGSKLNKIATLGEWK